MCQKYVGMGMVSFVGSLLCAAVALLRVVNADYILVPKSNVAVAMTAQLDTLVPIARFGAVNVYAGSGSMQLSSELASLYEIEDDVAVEVQGFPTAGSTTVMPWHLDRIDQRELPRDNQYRYFNTCIIQPAVHETTVNWVVDTGIDVAHPEFEGRATWGANYADTINTDCHGHGTHVAGIIGSRQFGVCKNASLVAVKVLNCNGIGTLSTVLKGLEYIKDNHQPGKKGIVNLSVGSPKSAILDMVIAELVNVPGLYIVSAAGNNNMDGCKYSPGGAEGTITVMAADVADYRATFSNYGNCTNIYAPGVDVQSTLPGGQSGTYSGTSMASPVVAGMLNLLVQEYPDMHARAMRAFVLQTATKYMVRNNPNTATPNRLAYLELCNQTRVAQFSIQKCNL